MLHCRMEQPVPAALSATIAIHGASHFIFLYITDIMREANAMARPLQGLCFFTDPNATSLLQKMYTGQLLKQ